MNLCEALSKKMQPQPVRETQTRTLKKFDYTKLQGIHCPRLSESLQPIARSVGLFERFSRLQPCNTKKHSPEYIQSVLEAAAGAGVDAESEKSPEEIQDFVKHFLDKPSDFSTTPAGITALKFEAWMIENDAAAFKQLVEVIVDSKEPEFLAVFQGEVSETDWEALVSGTKMFVELEKIVEAGDRSGDDHERSDVTVVEGTQTANPDQDDVQAAIGKKSDKSGEIFGQGVYEPVESRQGRVAMKLQNESKLQFDVMSLYNLVERSVKPEGIDADRLILEGLIVLDLDKYLLTTRGKEVLKQFKDDVMEAELNAMELSPKMTELFKALRPEIEKYSHHFAESAILDMQYVGAEQAGDGVQFRWVNEDGTDYMTLTVAESPDGYRTESAWFGMPRPALVSRFSGTLDEITGPSTFFPPDALKRAISDAGYMQTPVNLSSRFGTWSIQQDSDGNAQIAVGGDRAKKLKVDTSFVKLQERLDSLLAESQSPEAFDKEVEDLLAEMAAKSVPSRAGFESEEDLRKHYAKYPHEVKKGMDEITVILPEHKRKHRYKSAVRDGKVVQLFKGEGYHDEHSD